MSTCWAALARLADLRRCTYYVICAVRLSTPVSVLSSISAHQFEAAAKGTDPLSPRDLWLRGLTYGGGWRGIATTRVCSAVCVRAILRITAQGVSGDSDHACVCVSVCAGRCGRSLVSPDYGRREVVGTLCAMSEHQQWWVGLACPRCGTTFERWPARSRVDNNTYVCDPCGTREALWDAEHQGTLPLPPVTEPVVLGEEGERVMDDVLRLSEETNDSPA